MHDKSMNFDNFAMIDQNNYSDMNDQLIEITLIIEILRSEEKFTFSYKECNNDLDILMDQICYMKAIERSDDLRLVLAPDFIVMDLECIEDGNKVILKSYNDVKPIPALRQHQSL